MLDRSDVGILSGATVRTAGGDKIGRVAQVYLDDRTGRPEWVTVRTGLFGTKESFVPLTAARFEGHELVVDATRDQVTGAPRVDENGHLSEQQEAEIYRYYAITDRGTGRADGRSRDVAGHRPDDAMTRSKKGLVGGTQ